jgi:CPA1 family monovalent cation:H+ antiporter
MTGFCTGARVAAAPPVMVILLMPFVPYLLAEHFGLSGVLAAVAAGMAASYFDVRSTRFNAFHVQAQGTWEVIRFALTGLVFVLLGQQLPELLQNLHEPLQDLKAAGAALPCTGTGCSRPWGPCC